VSSFWDGAGECGVKRIDQRVDLRADLRVDLRVDLRAGLHPALGDRALSGLWLELQQKNWPGFYAV
jgi:hypothetical protein